MPLPPDNVNADISPKEFELWIYNCLSNLGKELKHFDIRHDTLIKSYDGEYQIDVLAKFESLGAEFKVLVECKRHKNKIKREVIQILHDKLHSTGSQKAILFSTSGFQEGAIVYAKQHGIALVRVIESKYTFVTKSEGFDNFHLPAWAEIPKYVGEYNNYKCIAYLQKGHFETLEEFLFGEK